MEWLPMETAPKDGDPVLLRMPESEHGMVIAFWSDETIGDTAPEDAGWYESEISGNRVDAFGDTPTGWCRLPPR